MGRIRTIKPEILEDDVTASLSDGAWRLFVSLWLLADDYGNLRGNPRWISGQVFWARQRDDTEELLRELVDAQLVRPYTVRGQDYLAIRSWAKHQKVDKPGKPHCPGPNEADKPDAAEAGASISEDHHECSPQQGDSSSNGCSPQQGDPLVSGADPPPIREGLAKVSRKSRESLAPDQYPDLGPRTSTPTTDATRARDDSGASLVESPRPTALVMAGDLDAREMTWPELESWLVHTYGQTAKPKWVPVGSSLAPYSRREVQCAHELAQQQAMGEGRKQANPGLFLAKLQTIRAEGDRPATAGGHRGRAPPHEPQPPNRKPYKPPDEEPAFIVPEGGIMGLVREIVERKAPP